MGTTSNSLQLPHELVTDIFSKVKGHSSLAALCGQTPIPFRGTDIMVFSMEGEMELVGEGGEKAPGEAAFEPVSSRTEYLYRRPLPYTVVPHDAAMDFFFDRVPEGTHLIDYPLLATQLGTFLNGIATVECMYAPEFRGQSAPLTVTVVK